MQTMARTIIRPATDADVDALRRVIADANEPYRGTVPASFFDAYLRSALDVAARLREADVLAAESAGRLVGTISFYVDANDEGPMLRFPPGTAGIRVTAVDPRARGQGIGRTLVDACIDRAAAIGSTGIALHTAAFMAGAVALYERAGFERMPEHDVPVSAFFGSDPTDDLVAIAYRRPIP